MSLVTLQEWNNLQPRPRSIEQVRRWVRAGKLYPPPYLDGREYLIQDYAVKIDPRNPKQIAAVYKDKKNLVQRMKDLKSSCR